MMPDGERWETGSKMARGRAALLFALLLTAIFGVNVAEGKLTNTAFMSDVAEAIVLFAASIFFVIGVLNLEGAANQAGKNGDRRNGHARREGTRGG
jgi:hypothetical protein